MLKNKLNNKQITIGSWITIGNTAVAEILAKAGFDWLVVDLEHSSINISECLKLFRIIQLYKKLAFVRISNKTI